MNQHAEEVLLIGGLLTAVHEAAALPPAAARLDLDVDVDVDVATLTAHHVRADAQPVREALSAIMVHESASELFVSVARLAELQHLQLNPAQLDALARATA